MYDGAFFAQGTIWALEAAEAVLPGFLAATGARTVIDVGCATGAWALVAQRLGCEVTGIDLYAPDDQVLIDDFRREDISQGVSCAGYDLAICLEVGEHLPAISAAPLVKGLCEARWVLWSAATPGQGGVDHVNEQWPEWWQPLFEVSGKCGSTALQERFRDDPRVMGWWSNNMIVWAARDDLERARFGV